MEQEFLTVKEAAKILNVSSSLVYGFCEQQRLGHYRFGHGRGAIRIKRSELMEFVKGCRVEEGAFAAPAPRSYVSAKPEPYVLKHLSLEPLPDLHPCGATTKAGTPCAVMTRKKRCHLHRETA